MLAENDTDKLKPIGPYLIGQVVGYVELKSNQHSRCLVGGSWYVISLEPHQGRLATAELAQAGLVPYLPLSYGPERHGRGQVRSGARPMFGPYMFVKCEDQHWGLVTRTRGVRRILGFEGRPESVPEGKIEVVRLQEALSFDHETERLRREAVVAGARERGKSGIVWQFSAGDVVRITSGPFAEFNAQLSEAVDSHDRIRAVVSLFGRESPVELSAFQIAAL